MRHFRFRRGRVALITAAGLAVAAISATGAAGGKHDDGSAKKLDKIQHIVVVYEENHSFDNLYGGWEGVNGRSNADAARTNQIAQNGLLYNCLLQNDVNLITPPQPGDCTDTSTGATVTSHFVNAPFPIETYIPKDARTCPQPGVFAPHGLTPSPANLPGGCTEDIVHRFYQEQYQLHGGKQDLYVTGSDAVGLTMGYYDTTKLPIYVYLHSRHHPDYVIGDDYFQGSFGGSFLNHQWLIAAATPSWTGMPANQHAIVDSNGMPNNYPLYHATGPVSDPAGTIACGTAPVTLPNLACGDYAVNTIQPPYQPTSSNPLKLSPQTGNDDRRRADCGARQLGVVLRRLVERRRRRRCAGLDERHGDDLHRSELGAESSVPVLPEQGVPVPPPAVQLLRQLRARHAGAGAPAGRGRVPEPRGGIGPGVQAQLGQLHQADRARERASGLHERAARQRPSRAVAAVDRGQCVREGHDGRRHL